MAVQGWSDLPADLLTDIAGGITELADIARFRAVCSSWRSAARAAAAAPPPQPPWLFLPSSPSRLFFSPREDRLYPNLRLPRPAAEAHRHRRRRLYASPHGWALAVDQADLAASLVHPFTGATRALPPLPAFFTETDDLAWDWSPHGVMVSCGEGILFCAADPPTAAASWAWVPIPALADCNATMINYAGGEFFVFEEDVCRTTVVDAATLAVATVIQAPAVELPAEARVVVAGDELFLLAKSKWMFLFGDDVDFSKAYHVNHRDVNPAWQELTGIGDRALFVDSFHGFVVPTAGFGNLESNTVYSVSSKLVSDRRATMNCSVSAFNLESRISKKLVCLLNGREMAMRGGKPSWIVPSLD